MRKAILIIIAIVLALSSYTEDKLNSCQIDSIIITAINPNSIGIGSIIYDRNHIDDLFEEYKTRQYDDVFKIRISDSIEIKKFVDILNGLTPLDTANVGILPEKVMALEDADWHSPYHHGGGQTNDPIQTRAKISFYTKNDSIIDAYWSPTLIDIYNWRYVAAPFSKVLSDYFVMTNSENYLNSDKYLSDNNNTYLVISPGTVNCENSDGVKNGVWIETNDNYIRLSNYKDDNLNGSTIYYDITTGIVYFIEEYKNGNLVSFCTFRSNGELKNQTIKISPIRDFNFSAGSTEWLYQGYSITYTENGAVANEGWNLYGEAYMLDNMKVELWRYYNQDQKIIKFINFGYQKKHGQIPTLK